jgi:polar amino acid transport system substrate-binding protein
MDIHKTLSICLSLLMAAPAAAASGGAVLEPLKLFTEEAEPTNMIEPGTGEITGIVTELVKKALEELGIPYTITMYSWARAYDLALHTENSCVFATGKFEDREALFKWVGPIIMDQWALFGPAGSPPLKSLDQVRDKKIGGNYRDGPTELMKKMGFKIDELVDYHTNMKRMSGHRIDYWVGGVMTTNYVMAHTDQLAPMVPLYKIRDIELDLACNKSLADETIAKLNALIRRYHQDGTVAAISKKYQ